MIISCPSCGASFNVTPEALGPTGRSVKCSKCAHRWHASADDDADGAVTVPAAEAAAETTADADPAETPPDGAETAVEAPETGSAADSVPLGGTDEDADSAAQAPGDISDAVDPLNPPPDLEAALGLAIPEEAEEAAGRRRSGSGRKSKATRKPARSKAKVLSFFVLLLLIAGVGAGAFFMKQKIMMWMPATQRLYALVGIEPEVLGQGLQIVEPTPKKEIDGNDEILIVEGAIRNTTAAPVDIPLMRGALLDKAGKELHIWTFTAAKSAVAPGDVAQYRTEFRNPPKDAESLDITFTQSDAVTGTATQEVKVQKAPETIPESSPPQSH